jgi:hypothetical protein
MPSFTAPGWVSVPLLFTGAPVYAPEVLASRPEGWLLAAPVVPPVIVPCFIASYYAPGPTLPWLDAPAGEASSNMQAEAKTSFFIR